jgi:Reverse transcriptase (RNA-dependent DNA polymerase)/Endonuclease-reverse transcriptase
MSNSRLPTDQPFLLRNIVLKSSFPNSEHFNFLHINPGSLYKHLDEFRALVRNVNLHLIAVSETWYTKAHNDNVVSIDGFSLIRHDRKGRAGGVAFYIKNGMQWKIVAKSHSNAKVEFLFVEIDNRVDTKFVVGVVYNPPHNSRLDTLKKILSELSNKYRHCVVLGDFNINLLDSNSAVRSFKEFLSSANLICPSSYPTNFVINKNPSQIDLLLVKDLTLVQRFSQLLLGSYTSHDIIYGTYKIAMNQSVVKKFRTVRSFKSICKNELLAAASALDWNSIYNLASVDEQVELVTEFLNTLMDRFAPLKLIEVINNSKPSWFTNELQRLINVRDFFHEAARLEKDQFKKTDFLLRFKRFRNKVTTLKRNLMTASVRSQLNPALPSAELWKNLKNLGVTSKPVEAAENFSSHEFNNYFSSVFSETSNFVLSAELEKEHECFQFECVDDEEVVSAINSISTNAIGEDGVPASFIKILCPFIVPFVTYIINNCITQSYFPALWKVANVRPIPKVSNPCEVDEFRPISILPSLSKVLERILMNQMQLFVTKNEMLYRFQSGFRSGHSTNSAMLKVIHDVAVAADNDQVTVLATLDLKKAFDLVNHEKLLVKLQTQFNFSVLACKMILSYLSDRWQRVRIGDDYSELALVTSGTPQGGILSSLLFCLFINDMSEIVDINLHLYADDSQLYCSAPCENVDLCIDKMNNTLSHVLKWADENSLAINPDKSKAIIISRREINPTSSVMLGAIPIDFCDCLNLLGLTVDRKLSWQPHINNICNGINSGVHMLRKTQSFTPVETRRRLVQALLVPKILYCSNIFMGCSKACWSRINLAFNSCLRYIFNLRKNQHVSAYKSKVLGCPINEYIQYRSCLFLFFLLRDKSPSYLYNELKFPKYPRARRIGVLPYRTEVLKTSFFVLGCNLWNSLSNDVRMSISSSVFKQQCLSYFASRAT